MNGEYDQLGYSVETAFEKFVREGGADRSLIDGFLKATTALYSFRLRTGLGIKDGEDRKMLRRGLTLLEQADLNTVDGRRAAVEYLTIQLESAHSLIEVVRGLRSNFGEGDVFEEIEEDIPRKIAAYEGAIDFLSSPAS